MINKISNNKASDRVGRGGSWNFNAGYCEVVLVGSGYPGHCYADLGFRVVKTKEVKNERK